GTRRACAASASNTAMLLSAKLAWGSSSRSGGAAASASCTAANAAVSMMSVRPEPVSVQPAASSRSATPSAIDWASGTSNVGRAMLTRPMVSVVSDMGNSSCGNGQRLDAAQGNIVAPAQRQALVQRQRREARQQGADGDGCLDAGKR